MILKNLVLAFTVMMLIGLAGAVPYVKLNETLNSSVVVTNLIPTVSLKNVGNLSKQNVNNSDFWDSLDTPADISAGDLGDGDFGAKNITTSGDILLANDYSSLFFGDNSEASIYFDGTNLNIIPNDRNLLSGFLINGQNMTSISTRGLGVMTTVPNSVFMEFQSATSGASSNTGEMLMQAKSAGYSALANMKMGHQINQNSRDSFLSLGVRGETSATAVERFRIIPQNSTFYNDLSVNGSLSVDGNLKVDGCIQYNCSDSCITLGSCI